MLDKYVEVRILHNKIELRPTNVSTVFEKACSEKYCNLLAQVS